MAHDFSQDAKWLGLNLQGDIGPITFYTSARGKAVAFPRVPPLNPPTLLQEIIRERFRNAANQWRSLSPLQRSQWLELADACNLGITGFNLFTHFACTGNFDGLRPLEQEAGFTVTRPTKV